MIVTGATSSDEYAAGPENRSDCSFLFTDTG